MKNWLAKFWQHDKSFFTTFVPFMLLMCIVYCLIAAKISREAGERIGEAYVRMMREELLKWQETEGNLYYIAVTNANITEVK